VHPLLPLAWVAAGGAVGGLLRAAAAELIGHEPGTWSWPVLVVNAVGAFALAALVTVLARRPSEHVRLLVGTGVLGALTTFSGVVVDVVLLADAGRPAAAVAYLLAAVASLLVAAALGVRVARS
jgi:CrcB protein